MGSVIHSILLWLLNVHDDGHFGSDFIIKLQLDLNDGGGSLGIGSRYTFCEACIETTILMVLVDTILMLLGSPLSAGISVNDSRCAFITI